MTTKKSKPASLTSSLLARKGEAEPATAPYSIPEAGRQRPADAATGKGNGNGAGGDLGHALSNLAASASGEKPSRGDISENGLHSQAARSAEPSRQQETSEDRPEAPSQVQAGEALDSKPELDSREPSAEEIFVESAVAEEISLDEAVIEASVSGGGADASSAAPAAAPEARSAAELTPGAPSGDDTGAGDKGDGDREAARDARLLRFVYAMAALTGIVAIVLYAGGWLRDTPKQQKAEAPVAAAPSIEPPAVQAPTETPMAAPQTDSATAAAPDSGSASSVIPVAPPVVPPGTVDEKPGAQETGVTTGGPAMSAMESTIPSPASPDSVGVAVTPSGASDDKPSQTEIAASGGSQPSVPVATPMPSAPGSAAPASESSDTSATATPGSAESQMAETDAKPVVPTPVAPEAPTTPPPAATEPVRDVPNLRVLAPAVGRPTPAETAPPTDAATAAKSAGKVPKLVVPQTEPQTAALPKSAPPKRAGASGGRYLVQLASVSSDAVARREWARLQKAYPDVFGDRTLVVEEKEIAGRGTFFRVQAGGYGSLDEARSVCAALKAKKQACLPVKR